MTDEKEPEVEIVVERRTDTAQPTPTQAPAADHAYARMMANGGFDPSLAAAGERLPVPVAGKDGLGFAGKIVRAIRDGIAEREQVFYLDKKPESKPAPLVTGPIVQLASVRGGEELCGFAINVQAQYIPALVKPKGDLGVISHPPRPECAFARIEVQRALLESSERFPLVDAHTDEEAIARSIEASTPEIVATRNFLLDQDVPNRDRDMYEMFTLLALRRLVQAFLIPAERAVQHIVSTNASTFWTHRDYLDADGMPKKAAPRIRPRLPQIAGLLTHAKLYQLDPNERLFDGSEGIAIRDGILEARTTATRAKETFAAEQARLLTLVLTTPAKSHVIVARKPSIGAPEFGGFAGPAQSAHRDGCEIFVWRNESPFPIVACPVAFHVYGTPRPIELMMLASEESIELTQREIEASPTAPAFVLHAQREARRRDPRCAEAITSPIDHRSGMFLARARKKRGREILRAMPSLFQNIDPAVLGPLRVEAMNALVRGLRLHPEIAAGLLMQVAADIAKETSARPDIWASSRAARATDGYEIARGGSCAPDCLVEEK